MQLTFVLYGVYYRPQASDPICDITEGLSTVCVLTMADSNDLSCCVMYFIVKCCYNYLVFHECKHLSLFTYTK